MRTILGAILCERLSNLFDETPAATPASTRSLRSQRCAFVDLAQ